LRGDNFTVTDFYKQKTCNSTINNEVKKSKKRKEKERIFFSRDFTSDNLKIFGGILHKIIYCFDLLKQ